PERRVRRRRPQPQPDHRVAEQRGWPPPAAPSESGPLRRPATIGADRRGKGRARAPRRRRAGRRPPGLDPGRRGLPPRPGRLRLHHGLWGFPDVLPRALPEKRDGPGHLLHRLHADLPPLPPRHGQRPAHRRRLLPHHPHHGLRLPDRRRLRRLLLQPVLAVPPLAGHRHGHRQRHALHRPRLAGLAVLHQEARPGARHQLLRRPHRRRHLHHHRPRDAQVDGPPVDPPRHGVPDPRRQHHHLDHRPAQGGHAQGGGPVGAVRLQGAAVPPFHHRHVLRPPGRLLCLLLRPQLCPRQAQAQPRRRPDGPHRHVGRGHPRTADPAVPRRQEHQAPEDARHLPALLQPQPLRLDRRALDGGPLRLGRRLRLHGQRRPDAVHGRHGRGDVRHVQARRAHRHGLHRRQLRLPDGAPRRRPSRPGRRGQLRLRPDLRRRVHAVGRPACCAGQDEAGWPEGILADLDELDRKPLVCLYELLHGTRWHMMAWDNKA
ncbi:hypothetical protein CTA2_12654, partial [Colletotrichum tanaceti]